VRVCQIRAKDGGSVTQYVKLPLQEVTESLIEVLISFLLVDN